MAPVSTEPGTDFLAEGMIESDGIEDDAKKMV